MSAYALIDWGMAAGLALVASLIALKVLKLAPLWAVVIGIVVFTGLHFPIMTHAVIQVPKTSN